MGIHYTNLVSTSELVQLSIEGIEQLETYVSLYLPQLFYSLLSPITLFIILSYYDVKSAIVLLICVPLLPLAIISVSKIAKRLLSKYWTSYTNLGDSFLENLQGLTMLKIYGSDEYKQQQMNQEAEDFRKVTMKVLIMQLNSISIMDIVAYGGAAIGSYVAIMHYQQQMISLYGALFIVLLSFEFFIPLRQLGSYFHIAMNGMAACDKIFNILDAKEKEDNGKEIKKIKTLSASHLSFSYNHQRQILKDIDFQVEKNQFIGIVGKSGSGKSTLAKLLMGYYDYQGDLLINDLQRNEYKETSLLSQFVYVSFEPMIFQGTVRDNLCLKEDYDDERLWDVLKQVRLDEFFALQQGLDTYLLEEGSSLSGGQKQRLQLARSLLFDGQVYIFDEATSNIDVESEEMILSVIEQLAKEKTVFMITHRLKNVFHCDCIWVMDEGRIVQKGHHQDIKNQGYYKELLEVQQGWEDIYGTNE